MLSRHRNCAVLPVPDLLHYILVFLRVKRLGTQRILDVAVSIFLAPAQVVQFLKIVHVEFMVWQVCNEVLERSRGYLNTDHPQGNVIFGSVVRKIIQGNCTA